MNRRADEPIRWAVVDATLGRIEVRPDPDVRSVRLLEVDGNLYGAVDLDDPARLELDYLVRLAAVVQALLPAGPCDLLHLGGGAFALPRALAARNPELTQVAVESSATVIALAREALDLRPTPRLDVVHDDARAVVDRRAPASTDVVIGDCFVGRSTPRHLASVEFVGAVACTLRLHGSYVLNVIDAPPWSALAAHAATVGTVFAHMLAVGSPGAVQLREPDNVLLVASHRPLHRPTLAWRLRNGPRPVEIMASRRLAALAAGGRPRHDADG